MGKDKLRKFAENLTFKNVLQPTFEEVFRKDYSLKGKWHKEYLRNNNPITLELGCGKGEYSVNLARKYPNTNFIGVDIKGARFWRGAKTALEEGILNVNFIRTRIELIDSFFAQNEVSEIWITFPDPQLKERRTNKRLTSPQFLNKYRSLLSEGGIIHLKTDSQELHEYTKAVLAHNNIIPIISTNNLYATDLVTDELSIKTHYEQLFTAQGKTITYLRFRLKKDIEIIDLPKE